MSHLAPIVALAALGYWVMVAGAYCLASRVIVPRVQAKRFAEAAVKMAEDDFRWSEFNRRLGP